MFSAEKKPDLAVTGLNYESDAFKPALRLCQWLALLVGCVLMARAVQWELTGRIIGLSVFFAFILLSILLSRVGRHRLAVHAFLLGYLIGANVGIVTSGGVHKVITGYILLLPAISALMGGKHCFVIWTSVAIVDLLILLVLNANGIGVDDQTPVTHRQTQAYIHVSSQLMLITLAMYNFLSQFELYERQLSEQLRRIQNEIRIRSVAEQRAVASNEAKTRFLSNMSHQLRTPLNSIIGFSRRLMLRNAYEDEKQQMALSSIYTNGKILLNIVNELLELADIDSREHEMKWQPVELSDIVRGEVEHMQNTLSLLPEKTLSLGRLEVFQMIGDLSRIPKIFKLILEYFFLHSESRRAVVECFSGAESDAWARVRLRFWGAGISSFELEECIKLEGGADLVSAEESRLAGLGLAIAGKLIALHRGDIAVSNPADDELVVEVTLPSVPDNCPVEAQTVQA